MNQQHTNYSLKKRAKTFYFASLFFPNNLRTDIKVLYEFCRYVDDLGDDSKQTIKISRKKLKKIKNNLKICKSNNKIVSGLISICNKYNIKTSIPMHLVDGVLSDLYKVDFKNNSELIEYSYKVAGTVGIMMCSIMRVNNKKMKLRAVQLGIAMQLTNIARDIKEDLYRDRIYFPKQLRSHQTKDFKKLPSNKEIQTEFSKDLENFLNMADRIYRISWNGIIMLPIKFRVPIAVASFLYQSIGVKIRSSNYDIWNQRIYLNLSEKLVRTIKVFFKLFFDTKINKDKAMDEEIRSILNKFKLI